MEKTRMIWTFGAVALLVVAAAVLAGCTGASGDVRTLTVNGSTTVFPIAQKAAEAFMDKNSDADIQVSAGGSGVGIQSVGDKTVDIGLSSRELKSEETSKYPALKTYTVAKDGIAMIVNKGNGLTQISMDQIKGIYNGTYTNWKDLGGADLTIVIIGRDSSSGTREYFFEAVMKKQNFTSGIQEENSNGAIHGSVKNTPGAIGYVGLGYVDSDVKGLKVLKDTTAVEPTVQNVLDGKYPISRNLYMVTNGEATGLAKEFIDYILSSEGQKIVKEEGFVPLPK